MFSDIPMPGSLITDTENEAEAQMDSLIADLSAEFPAIKIERLVTIGSTIDAVNEFIETTGVPLFIVVGNSSDSDSRIWPESILLDEVRQLQFPVLAVPEGYKWANPGQLCFACDSNHSYSAKEIARIKDAAKTVNGTLYAINIQTEEKNAQDLESISKSIGAEVGVGLDKVHVITGSKNIDNSILDAIKKFNVEWLIMVPGKHSFFEGLFHKSHTSKILHSCPIPILAIHD